MKTEITFPGRVPGLNGSGGLLRMHWRKRNKIRNTYAWYVRSLTKNRHLGAVSLKLIRYSTGVAMDYLNLVSTGKVPIDSLVLAKVITDDKDSVIQKQEYVQVKCKKGEQRTVIIIEDL